MLRRVFYRRPCILIVYNDSDRRCALNPRLGSANIFAPLRMKPLLLPSAEPLLKNNNASALRRNQNRQTVHDLVRPETPLERAILNHPEWLEGALWGEPRWGHPEGKVILHIREVLDNVERVSPHYPHLRESLRLITILHDTFKYKEEQVRPRRDWSQHHAVFAARFARLMGIDPLLSDHIELHDEAYYAWIDVHFKNKTDKAQQRLLNIEQRLGGDWQLYYLFFKCDTQTGDKTQLPVNWLENQLSHRVSLLDF